MPSDAIIVAIITGIFALLVAGMGLLVMILQQAKATHTIINSGLTRQITTAAAAAAAEGYERGRQAAVAEERARAELDRTHSAEDRAEGAAHAT